MLETTDESLLSDRIARIVTDDSLLFVYDDTQEQVFVFDISGKYLHKIDRKGQGPGEYVQNCDFTLDTDNKQIILSVDIPSKFMYFTYDCRFIKEENLPYLSKLVKDDTFIYGDNYMGEKYQIEILDTESEVKKERLEMMDIKNYAVLRGNSMSRGKDVLFVRRYDNSIYELANGEITKKYQVDFKNHNFPERFMEETESGVIFKDSEDNGYIYSMSNAFNSDNYLTFYTNRGIFFYDRRDETLKGYKEMKHSNRWFSGQDFKYYLPLENTDKMIFIIEEPSFIKRIAEHAPDEFKQDRDYLEIKDIADKMTDDNNPILLIYEFRD